MFQREKWLISESSLEFPASKSAPFPLSSGNDGVREYGERMGGVKKTNTTSTANRTKDQASVSGLLRLSLRRVRCK